MLTNNLLVLTDGKSPKVYDGQTVYKAGLPKVVQVLETTAGGALTGSFFYFILKTSQDRFR